MRELNFKFWMILLILMAGISWWVLPKYNPSFDFIGKKEIGQKEISLSHTTSQPVGHALLAEESEESFKASADEFTDTNQTINSENNDKQKLNELKENPEKLFHRNNSKQATTSTTKDTSRRASSSLVPGASSRGNLMVGGASTPKEIKVSETGEGETLLLREALRQVLPGGSIHLQKGYYKVHLGEMRIPESTIRGEGSESILEFNDTFRVGTSDLKFQNLKIIHYGTSEAFSVSAGKKLTLEKVFLQNNANDGVMVVNAHLIVNDLELRGSQHAIVIKNAISLEAQNIRLSDVDYGISIEGNKNLTIKELIIQKSNVFPIHFLSEGTGQLTCLRCSFDKKPSNNTQRLILKK